MKETPPMAEPFSGPPRDPARIDRIIAKLGWLWKQYPDERFGQFILNYVDIGGIDLYNLEDDAAEELLDAAIVDVTDSW